MENPNYREQYNRGPNESYDDGFECLGCGTHCNYDDYSDEDVHYNDKKPSSVKKESGSTKKKEEPYNWNAGHNQGNNRSPGSAAYQENQQSRGGNSRGYYNGNSKY
jgi:hypothetical protein